MEHSASREGSDSLSVYHPRLIPFGLRIFSICRIIVLENVDNVRAKFRDSLVQDMVGEWEDSKNQ